VPLFKKKTASQPEASKPPEADRSLTVNKSEEADYYKAAASWDDDRVLEAVKSRKVAWVVAGSACSLAGILALALTLLVPLKRVETQLVRVDSSTGIVDNVIRLKDAELGKDELMSRYFLRKYVVLRKSYTRQQLQLSYDQLTLLTDPKLRVQLKQEFQMTSPTSPFTRYGELGVADVKIKSVAFLQSNIAQVRYYIVERKSGAETQVHEVATIEFRYVAAPASEATRQVNPLGFLVTSWRADPEAYTNEEGTK
jgi:type IV secretion system protein VirB8